MLVGNAKKNEAIDFSRSWIDVTGKQTIIYTKINAITLSVSQIGMTLV